MSTDRTIAGHAHAQDDHAHHHHGHAHSHISPQRMSASAVLAPSFLRLGLGGRLLIAGSLVLLVWTMILGVLS